MSEDKVKGILLMDPVRFIRANKDLPWEEYLTREDMELVKGNILPSTWYPFDVFERVGYAVFMLIGKGDFNLAKAFGAFTVQETYKKVYENLLFNEKDPLSLLKKFLAMRKQFFRFKDPDFEFREMEVIEENRVRIRSRAPGVSKYLEAYAHHLAGSFEKLLEMAGANEVQVKILEIQSESIPATVIDITW